MNHRHRHRHLHRSALRHPSFITTFVDAVTIRPFLDDLARVRRAANLRASLDLLRAELERDEMAREAA